MDLTEKEFENLARRWQAKDVEEEAEPGDDAWYRFTEIMSSFDPVLRRLRKVNPRLSRGFYSRARKRIRSAARKPRIGEAFAAARRISSPSLRASALIRVAEIRKGKAREDTAREALAAVNHISEPQSRLSALISVAKLQQGEARQETLDEALTATQQIPDELHRGFFLLSIGELTSEKQSSQLSSHLAALSREDIRQYVLKKLNKSLSARPDDGSKPDHGILEMGEIIASVDDLLTDDELSNLSEDDWGEIMRQACELLGADSLDSPARHLEYVRARIAGLKAQNV